MAIQVSGSKMKDTPNLKADTSGYGQNSPQPSSVPCDQSADLSALDISHGGEDAKRLVTAGLHHDILHNDSDDWQRRKIEAGRAVPLAGGMKKPDGSPSGHAGENKRPVFKR